MILYNLDFVISNSVSLLMTHCYSKVPNTINAKFLIFDTKIRKVIL